MYQLGTAVGLYLFLLTFIVYPLTVARGREKIILWALQVFTVFYPVFASRERNTVNQILASLYLIVLMVYIYLTFKTIINDLYQRIRTRRAAAHEQQESA